MSDSSTLRADAVAADLAADHARASLESLVGHLASRASDPGAKAEDVARLASTLMALHAHLQASADKLRKRSEVAKGALVRRLRAGGGVSATTPLEAGDESSSGEDLLG